jgi:hypothetical protein
MGRYELQAVIDNIVYGVKVRGERAKRRAEERNERAMGKKPRKGEEYMRDEEERGKIRGRK